MCGGERERAVKTGSFDSLAFVVYGQLSTVSTARYRHWVDVIWSFVKKTRKKCSKERGRSRQTEKQTQAPGGGKILWVVVGHPSGWIDAFGDTSP